MQLVDEHQALIDSGERLYDLSPDEDALPALHGRATGEPGADIAGVSPDHGRLGCSHID